MEKLSFYRTAIDAANFLVDFMTKENFYSRDLHTAIWKFCESVTEKLSDIVLENVTPKVD